MLLGRRIQAFAARTVGQPHLAVGTGVTSRTRAGVRVHIAGARAPFWQGLGSHEPVAVCTREAKQVIPMHHPITQGLVYVWTAEKQQRGKRPLQNKQPGTLGATAQHTQASAAQGRAASKAKVLSIQRSDSSTWQSVPVYPAAQVQV
jgi:hypothetical protein